MGERLGYYESRPNVSCEKKFHFVWEKHLHAYSYNHTHIYIERNRNKV